MFLCSWYIMLCIFEFSLTGEGGVLAHEGALGSAHIGGGEGGFACC